MAETPSPSIGTEEEPRTETRQTPNVNDDITATLQKLGISSKEQIEGMATASKETGRMAQILGDVRQELSQTQAQLRAMQQAQQSRQPEQDLYNDLDERPLTMRELKSFYRDITEAQTTAQKQAWGEWSSIQNDPRYPAFKERFEKELQRPENQHALNTGQTNLRTLYKDVVVEGLMGVIVGMKDKIDQTETPGKRTPPHMESQTPTTPTTEIDKTDIQERLAAATKDRKGTDDDVRKMLDAILPDGDITNMRMTT